MVDVDLNNELANRLGLTHGAVSQILSGSFDGKPVGIFWEGDRAVTPLLRLDKNERSSFDDVRDAYMESQLTHASVPLRLWPLSNRNGRQAASCAGTASGRSRCAASSRRGFTPPPCWTPLPRRSRRSSCLRGTASTTEEKNSIRMTICLSCSAPLASAWSLSFSCFSSNSGKYRASRRYVIDTVGPIRGSGRIACHPQSLRFYGLYRTDQRMRYRGAKCHHPRRLHQGKDGRGAYSRGSSDRSGAAPSETDLSNHHGCSGRSDSHDSFSIGPLVFPGLRHCRGTDLLYVLHASRRTGALCCRGSRFKKAPAAAAFLAVASFSDSGQALAETRTLTLEEAVSLAVAQKLIH